MNEEDINSQDDNPEAEEQYKAEVLASYANTQRLPIIAGGKRGETDATVINLRNAPTNAAIAPHEPLPLHAHYRDHLVALGFTIARGKYPVITRNDRYTAFPLKDRLTIQYQDAPETMIDDPLTKAVLTTEERTKTRFNRRVYVANRTTITFRDFATHAPATHLSFQRFSWEIAKHGVFSGTIDVTPFLNEATDTTVRESGIGSIAIRSRSLPVHALDADGVGIIPVYRLHGLLAPRPASPDMSNVIACFDWELLQIEPLFSGPLVPIEDDAPPTA